MVFVLQEMLAQIFEQSVPRAVVVAASPQKKTKKETQKALIAKEDAQYWTEIQKRAAKGYLFGDDAWFPVVIDNVQV